MDTQTALFDFYQMIAEHVYDEKNEIKTKGITKITLTKGRIEVDMADGRMFNLIAENARPTNN